MASDGGIFAVDAPFQDSAGSLVLDSPIIGMEAAPDGSGCRLVARDGGVFSCNPPLPGGYAGQDSHPTISVAGQGDTGYWLLVLLRVRAVSRFRECLLGNAAIAGVRCGIRRG